ncbi:cadherin-like beta sandwich domain-containing protein [Haliangium ochraceum]|nr:cadherin-like beta sandwich domain-containing protein [Haliangium ochraceum]
MSYFHPPARRRARLGALACVAALASALSACGGGDGSGPDPDIPDAAPPDVPDAMLDANADLSALTVSQGTLAPIFAPHVTSYRLSVSLLVADLNLQPTAASAAATVSVDGSALEPGAGASVPLDIGDNVITIEVTAEAGNLSSYTLTVTRTAAVFDPRYIKADDPISGEEYGTSVSLDGDFLAVGVPKAAGVHPDDPDRQLSESGGVYVLRREGTVWFTDAYLTAANAGSLDLFGASVALSGDMLAVGAPGEASGDAANPDDNERESSGAVYIFRRGDEGWTQEAYLKADNLDGNDTFGSAVAAQGALVAVGAPAEDSFSAETPDDDSNPNSGAVYVFAYDGAAWQQSAYLKANNPDPSDGFGSAIALADTLLVAGAPGEDSARAEDPDDDSASGSGAAYGFRLGGDDAWTEEVYLKAGNAGGGDSFGSSVAVSGEVIAVGAPGESSATGNDGNDNNASGSGAVYTYEPVGGAWMQRTYLKAANLDSQDGFGTSLALRGGVLAVGAPGESSGDAADPADDSAADSGAVYLFLGAGSAWLQEAYLKPDMVIDASDAFGASVALSDIALAVGAIGESSGIKVSPFDNSARNSGAVYLYQ